MNIIQVTILFSLIIHIYSDCDMIVPSKKKDCYEGLSDEDKEDFSYCCFFKGKKEKIGPYGDACQPLTKEEYNNIKQYITDVESLGAQVDKLDCKSNYLNISLLILVILLL